MNTKYCKACDESKPINLFGIDRSKKSGIRYRCKACDAAATAKYRKVFPEKVNSATSAWRNANKERVSEAQRKYRADHEDHYRGLHAEWVSKNHARHVKVNLVWREGKKAHLATYAKTRRESDPGRYAVALREWQAKNPEKVNALNGRRRAARLSATVVWADRLKISEIYKKAAKMTAETGVPHHVDHIVPLQSKIVCGLHCEANLQVLTAAENSSKHNRRWPDMPCSLS